MRATCLVFAFSLLNLIFSCSYFKVKEVKSENAAQKQEQIRRFNQEQKYLVVHTANEQYHLDNVQLDTENEMFSGELLEVSERHLHKKSPDIKIKKTYRYNTRKTDPLNEIHIYLKSDQQLELGETSIPISAIDRIAVVDKNVGRTIINVVGSTIGILALALIIFALTKSSCPYIYAHDGENYVFNGELYPGNIIRNAQNMDYLILDNMCLKDGEYKIKISNELLEVQHTDLVEMLYIDHPLEHQVLIDPEGRPVILEEMIFPALALSNGIPVTDLVSLDDEKYFGFDQPSIANELLGELSLHFPRKEQNENISLHLRLKNAMWLDYIFGKFNEKFGDYYHSFQKQQQDFSLSESRDWQESQHIPLNVYVKRNGKWVLEEKISSTGPMAFRDIGLNIDLQGVPSNEIEIKLETGLRFWEIDQAAISFSSSNTSEVKVLKPARAVTQNGVEVSRLIDKNDGEYLTQKFPGEYVEIFFEAPPIPEAYQRSLFIKNKGYYNYIRDYEGIPNFTELLKFKRPGYFTEFSKTEFENMLKSWEPEKSVDYAL
ncbi:hypothetical protein GCM10023115_50680 [Pontixanthobacter gangjinensis]